MLVWITRDIPTPTTETSNIGSSCAQGAKCSPARKSAVMETSTQGGSVPPERLRFEALPPTPKRSPSNSRRSGSSTTADRRPQGRPAQPHWHRNSRSCADEGAGGPQAFAESSCAHFSGGPSDQPDDQRPEPGKPAGAASATACEGGSPIAASVGALPPKSDRAPMSAIAPRPAPRSPPAHLQLPPRTSSPPNAQVVPGPSPSKPAPPAHRYERVPHRQGRADWRGSSPRPPRGRQG